jgi:hypothetical protein
MVKHVKVSLVPGPLPPFESSTHMQTPVMFDYPTTGLHISQLFHLLVDNAENFPFLAQMRRCLFTHQTSTRRHCAS